MYAALAIAGLAASLAGTGLGIAANEQSQSQLNSVRQQEAAQQQQLRQSAQQQVARSLAQSSPEVEQAQINKGAAQRYNAFKQLQAAVAPTFFQGSQPENGNKIVNDSPSAQDTQRTNTSGGAWSDLMARAQGNLGGYSDMENEQNIKNSDVMGQLGLIGTEAGNDASLDPLEQQLALQSGDSMGAWGSLLSSLGNLSMMGATGLNQNVPAQQYAQVRLPQGNLLPAKNYSTNAFSAFV